LVSFKAFGRRVKLDPLSDLARIVFITLDLFLALEATDLAINGELSLMFAEGWLSFLLAAEALLGMVAPVFIFDNQNTPPAISSADLLS
jgi:hypothetical protein